LGVYVVDERFRDDAELDVAVDAAEGQIVDIQSEGRDVGALRGVQFHGDDVVGIELEVRRELEAEWRIAALVLVELVPFYGDRGGGHGAAEVQKDALAPPFRQCPK